MANSNSDSDNDTDAPASPLDSDSVSQFLSSEPFCAPSSSVSSSVVNVRDRVATLELLNQVSSKLAEYKSANMGLKEDLKPLISPRGGLKARVTIILNGLRDSDGKDELNLNLFRRQEIAIKEFFEKINKAEDEIEDIYDLHDI